MVDSETRLDNTIALPGNVFQYHYTLVNRTAKEIEIKEIDWAGTRVCRELCLACTRPFVSH